MWISPNHPNPPRQPSPPEETGEPLGTFPRNQGAEELRVSLAEYNGHRYIALRIWERDQAGQFWPSKRGLSIRLRECAQLADILAAVVDGQPDTIPSCTRPHQPPARRADPPSQARGPSSPEPPYQLGRERRPQSRRPSLMPVKAPAEAVEPFDEFQDGT